jgi:ParB family chromosome partitioning protein
MTHLVHTTGDEEWYTPPHIVGMAKSVMGSIDLDPASNEVAQGWIGAETFFTKKDNGLIKPWFGNVWLNPPYDKNTVEAFIDKAIHSPIKQYVILLNNITETAYGQKIIKNSDMLCFPKGRLRFIRADGKKGNMPSHGQMILYKGSNTDRFHEIFSQIGVVLSSPKA